MAEQTTIDFMTGNKSVVVVDDATLLLPIIDDAAMKVGELEAAYVAAIQQPVSYMSTTFQADDYSRGLLTEAVANYTAKGAVPAGFWWKDAANNRVTMDLVQLQGLGDAFAAQVWQWFQHLDAQKRAISDTVAANALPNTDPAYIDDVTARATIDAITW